MAGEGGRWHEDLARDDAVVGASDRAFGLTIAGFCVLVGVIRLALGHGGAAWLGAALIFFAPALVRPALLAPLNRLWLRLGLLLHKFVTPVIMALIFFTTVLPTGLLMRAFGKDPLRLKREPDTATYWIARDASGIAPDTMKNQF